jgi:hypothetical protein
MADIFVSHASGDAVLVEELVQLLEGGVGLRSAQIFCTSLEGQGIPPGIDFKEHIRNNISNAQIVLGLISTSFYNSPFCMCELGATWVQAKSFIPCLVPPITPNDLRGVLGGVQCLSIDRGNDLDAIYSILQRTVNDSQPVARWNTRKERFLERLLGVLKSLPQVQIVKLADYEKVKGERDNYAAEYKKLDAEIVKREEIIKQLSALKDSKSVTAVLVQNTSMADQFRHLINQALAALEPLSRVVTEAIFHDFKADEFELTEEDWRTAALEEENGFLKGDEQSFWVNKDHPKVRRALAALNDLNEFIEKSEPDLSKWYEREYDELLRPKSRAFWKYHGLLGPWG